MAFVLGAVLASTDPVAVGPGVAEMVPEAVREHLDAALTAAPGDDLVDAGATGLGSATALIPIIRDEKSHCPA